MSRFWTDTVRRLTPYVPGEQRAGDGIVKLNTNENPYPPSDKVMAAIASVVADSLRRYPDPESRELRTALANAAGMEASEVFVGNGSDEILALAFLAFFTNGEGLQYPDISYSFYPVYCDLYGIPQRPRALAADFSIDTTRFEENTGGICFPNPNAPTGIALGLDAIEALLERHSGKVLLIDEAYADFGAASALSLIDKYPNLIVTRTFSKGRSLAGLRLGAAYAQADLIDGLQRVKNSFNSYPVDAVAQCAGLASLADDVCYRENIARIVATRECTIRELTARGFRVLPSSANFILARPADGRAEELFHKLGSHDVLVRYWATPALAEWLRISIGSDADMQRLFAVIDNPE